MKLSGATTNDLWRAIAGSDAKPGDSDYDLLKRLVGVTARTTDSFNDLLRKWLGAGAFPGDSDRDLLRKKLTVPFSSTDTFRDLLARLAYSMGIGAPTSDSSLTVDSMIAVE